MFAAKLKHIMYSKEDIPIEDQNKLPGYIEQYFDAVKPGPLIKPKQVVTQHLNSLNDLKNYILEIKSYYVRCQGDYRLFRKFILDTRPLLPPVNANNVSENQKPNIKYLIFHLLIGLKVPTEKIVTFSYWDKLVVQFILAWCCYRNYQIQMQTLFQIIDSINGDVGSKVIIRE